jgi:hypothetical protein
MGALVPQTLAAAPGASHERFALRQAGTWKIRQAEKGRINVEDDDVVEELAPNAADSPFSHAVLPWTPRRRASGLGAEGLHRRHDLRREDAA